MAILHDLGVVFPRRLRALVWCDCTTKRRERVLSRIYTDKDPGYGRRPAPILRMERLPHRQERQKWKFEHIQLTGLDTVRRPPTVNSTMTHRTWRPLSIVHLMDCTNPAKYQKQTTGGKAPLLVIRQPPRGPTTSSQAVVSRLASSS